MNLPPIQADILRSIAAHNKPRLRHIMGDLGLATKEIVEFHLCRLRLLGLVEGGALALTAAGKERVKDEKN